MAAKLPITVIYNPNSTGDSEANARQFRDELKDEANVSVRLIATEHAGHAEELARGVVRRNAHALVVSASGDGGYNEVVNGAVAAGRGRPVCAVLASGNANDHDRAMLDRPLVEAVRARRTRPMDLIRVQVRDARGKLTADRYAHSYIGIGMTPTVAVELNRHSLTAIKEIIVLARSFARLQPVEITVRDRTWAVDSLVISNIGGMAKVLKLAQHYRTDDGLFELNSFKHGRKFRLVGKLLLGATFGLRPSARLGRFEFATPKELVMQLDGEIITIAAGSKVVVTSVRHAITTFA